MLEICLALGLLEDDDEVAWVGGIPCKKDEATVVDGVAMLNFSEDELSRVTMSQSCLSVPWADIGLEDEPYDVEFEKLHDCDWVACTATCTQLPQLPKKRRRPKRERAKKAAVAIAAPNAVVS